MVHSFISQWDVVAAAVWAALFNSLPTVCIVTGCVWLLLERVKGWSAAMRYAGWCGLLMLAIGLPVMQFVMPHESVAPVPVLITPTASDMTRTDVTKNLTMVANDGAALAVMSHDDAPAVLAPAPAAAQKEVVLSTTMWGLTAGGGLLLLWVAAMMVQLARLGMALRCNVVLKRSGFAPDEAVAARWNELLRTNEDIQRPVRLALSSVITMPAVVGYRRPLVLLPDTLAARLSGEELDGILLHELAHVRRRDDWAIAAQRFVQAVFALHPLVHLMASKMELQREIACDDWVLRSQQARVYASSLTSVAEHCLRPAHSGLMGLAMERPSQLGERVTLLLDSTRPVMTRISMRWLGGFVSALGLAGVLSLQLPEVMAFPVQASVAPAAEPSVAVEQSPAAEPVPSATPVPLVAPMKIDPIAISPVKVNPHVVVVTPQGMTHVMVKPVVMVDPEIADERLSQEHGLTEEQRRQIRKQVEVTRQQIEKSRVQMEKQLHEQLEPQMRQLREQLSHMDMNRVINESVRAQMRAGHLEAEAAMSQALAELSREGKEAQLTQAQRDRIQAEQNRYQAQMAQLRAQQEKAAKEFGERISAIVNDAVNRALNSSSGPAAPNTKK